MQHSVSDVNLETFASCPWCMDVNRAPISIWRVRQSKSNMPATGPREEGPPDCAVKRNLAASAALDGVRNQSQVGTRAPMNPGDE